MKRTELEKVKEALTVATNYIRSAAMNTDDRHRKEALAAILDRINAILAPDPPEFEEVDVKRWGAYTKDGLFSATYESESDADRYKPAGGSHTLLAGFIKREKKQPVVRSVEGIITGRGGMVPTVSVTIPVHNGTPPPMQTKVTLTWEEPAE
jgi:hypothetical protein